MTGSLLSTTHPEEVIEDPFPHIVIRGALGEERAADLRRSFPSPEVIAEGKPLGSNLRFSYPASKSLDDDRIPGSWQETVRGHISQEFLGDLLRVFGPSIEKCHPGLLRKIRKDGGPRAGTREVDTFNGADILLDAQISMNTPVTEDPDSVRGPHIDAPNKLFAGLYYLRDPRDDSEGGALELYRAKKGGGYRLHSGQHVDSRYLERAARVPYEDDTLVLFLNSSVSFHGVTIRQKTVWPRLFLNLVGEIDMPLYDQSKIQEGRLRRMLRGAGLLESRNSEYHG